MAILLPTIGRQRFSAGLQNPESGELLERSIPEEKLRELDLVRSEKCQIFYMI